jgi:hypothetical protein
MGSSWRLLQEVDWLAEPVVVVVVVDRRIVEGRIQVPWPYVVGDS